MKESSLRPTLASDGPAAAFALAFGQGVLAVVLGERVPADVALAILATELLLAWLALGLLAGALSVLPGLRALVADRGRTQLLMLVGIGFFVGGSWVVSSRPPSDLPVALGAWVLAHGVGLAILQAGLRRAGRLPAAGLGAFLPRAVVVGFVASGSLATIHGVAGASGAASRPFVYALLQALASFVGPSLALALPLARRRGEQAVPRPASTWMQMAAGTVVLALLAWGLHTGGPRRSWRDASPTAASSTASDDARPNLLLVSIDTLGSRHVGAYGYERDTTPVLDALAGEGALFENSIATAPWTLPSHGTLFTGRYPGDLPGYRVAGTPSLAPLLREAGYRTVGFTAGYFVGEDYFGEGFDLFADDYEAEYVLGLAPSFLQAGLRIRRSMRHLGLGFRPLNPVNHWRLEGGGVSAFAGPRPGAEAAADWIRERGRQARPFFLFFHTFGAHEYYLATDAMRAGADRWAGDYEGWLRGMSLRFGSQLPKSAEELRYLVALYDAGIRDSDEALGLVLRALEETGLDEDTLVVVTSDHGEGFRPDLARTWHLGRLHDDLLRVPLVMRMPGRIPEGLRIERQVSGVDVLPTALDLLGVAAPEGVRGQSVASLLEGRPAPGLREEAYSQVADHDPDKRGTSVRSRGFKLIRSQRSGEELYDLRGDPEETRNLAARPPPVAPRMRRELERFEREVSQDTPELDDAMEDQLRALGYVE